MKQTSTMFLTSVTCIDHAYIDQYGHVVGGSFSPDFWVFGDVDPQEQVVIDFSQCKKQIKEAIDNVKDGYDHKLWFIPGFSQGEYVIENGRVTITTQALTIEGPEDMVRVFKTANTYNDFDQELSAHLLTKIPKVGITIGLDPSKQFTIPNRMTPSFFRYSHGLKSSTSYGCKNIAHGHLSYIAIDSKRPGAFILQEKIAKLLDKSMFVFKENIKDNVIEYNCARGHFKITINTNVFNPQPICIMTSETTIENIVEEIHNMYKDSFREEEVYSLYISEGVHKGACKYF